MSVGPVVGELLDDEGEFIGFLHTLGEVGVERVPGAVCAAEFAGCGVEVGEEGCACAAELFGVDEDAVGEKVCGGGVAEGGVCGVGEGRNGDEVVAQLGGDVIHGFCPLVGENRPDGFSVSGKVGFSEIYAGDGGVIKVR